MKTTIRKDGMEIKKVNTYLVDGKIDVKVIAQSVSEAKKIWADSGNANEHTPGKKMVKVQTQIYELGYK